MPQDVDSVVVGSDLEVAVGRVEPTVEDLGDLEPASVPGEAPRLLLPSVAGVAFDLDIPVSEGHSGDHGASLSGSPEGSGRGEEKNRPERPCPGRLFTRVI